MTAKLSILLYKTDELTNSSGAVTRQKKHEQQLADQIDLSETLMDRLDDNDKNNDKFSPK